MLRPFPASLVLAATLLVGCGKPAEQRQESITTLTFWHIMNYSGPEEILADAVRRFEAAHPGVRVEVQTFANDAYKQKLPVEMASNTPPDVFFTWGGGMLAEFARAGRVVNLDQALLQDGWRERFIEQALAICATPEGTFAVPLDLSVVALWYNRDLLAKHGIEPPATLDDLLVASAKLKAAGITPVSLGNRTVWPGAFHFIYLAARRGGAELFLDAAAGKASFADPAFVAAGEDLRRLIDAGVFPSGFNGLDDGAARTRFFSEEAAMYLMGNWLVPRAMTAAPEFMDRLGCIPFPAVADGKGDPRTVVGGVNCGFAVSSSCPHPELAIELLRYLTAPEVVDAWCGIGRIPALQVGVEQVAKLPPPTRAAHSLLVQAPRLQPYYDQYLPPRLAEEHTNTTQGIFAGTLTPQAAAERMAKQAAGNQ
ncbi:MAG: extracellular solute-binding protein [Lentisphaeria bacterium]|jgi:raffinose/stachyose/melibiose transport system substrate-binding protein|nr:extracellular solute-binding protein [Lentisphaeria bacterium]